MTEVALTNYCYQIVSSQNFFVIQIEKSKSVIYIETPRLILRDWDISDLEPFVKMGKDPQVMKYFPDLLTKEESTEIYHRVLGHFQEWGYGIYAAELKETEQFIGFIGLMNPRFESDFTPCVEIGWRLTPQVWGKGLATEGAKAVLKYAFQNLQLKEIYSFTSLENAPSFKVMKKIGMKKVSTFIHPNLPENHPLSEHWLYCIRASEEL